MRFLFRFIFLFIVAFLLSGILSFLQPTPEEGEGFLGESYYEGKVNQWEVMVIYPSGKKKSIILHYFNSIEEMKKKVPSIKRRYKNPEIYFRPKDNGKFFSYDKEML